MAVREDSRLGGFFAIAATEKTTAARTMKIWRLRRAVDPAFAWPGRTGDFPAEGGERMVFLAFLAAIMRDEIQRACEALEPAPGETLEEIWSVRYELAGKEYQYGDIAGENQRKLLKAPGIMEDMLRDFAPDVTRRCVGKNWRRRKTDCRNALPWGGAGQEGAFPASAPTESSPSGGHSEDGGSEAPAPKPRHPGGRPKGSRNRKTPVREAEERARWEAEGYAEPEKRKAGRPEGRKDSCQRTRSTESEMEERRREMEQKGKE